MNIPNGAQPAPDNPMPDDEVLAIASAFDPTQIQRVTAIPTTLNGVTFRSRTEARWSVFFDSMGIEWDYEPEGLELPSGARYLPDFYLPRFRWFAEVKPTGEILRQERKAIAFSAAAGLDMLLLVGNPYFHEYEAVRGAETHWTFCLDTEYHGTEGENRFWSCGDCEHEYSDRYQAAVWSARGARF